MRERSVFAAAVLSEEEIARLRSFAFSVTPDDAGFGTTPVSTERWLTPERHGDHVGWLFDMINRAVEGLNDDYFGVDIFRGRPAPLRYLEMQEGAEVRPAVELSYKADGFAETKLVFSMLLSRLDEFSGGDLFIGGTPLGEAKQREPGTLVVFPSYIPYEVLPVQRGVRIGIQGVCIGPLWR